VKARFPCLSGIEHYLNDAAMELLTTEVHQILTRTSGYLRGISSHSLQPYRGCALGNSLCGVGCYVRHNIYVTRGRAWGSFVEVRHGAASAYLATVRRERDWAHKACGRFGIFMSSSTEPFQPIERRAGVTRQLLEAMLSNHRDAAGATAHSSQTAAPDELIIQTHSHRVTDYLELYRALDRVTSLRFHVTIESDRDSLPGLPPSASTVSRRFAAAPDRPATLIFSARLRLCRCGGDRSFHRRRWGAARRWRANAAYRFAAGDGGRRSAQHHAGLPRRHRPPCLPDHAGTSGDRTGRIRRENDRGPG
jgi:hypothetical protein